MYRSDIHNIKGNMILKSELLCDHFISIKMYIAVVLLCFDKVNQILHCMYLAD